MNFKEIIQTCENVRRQMNMVLPDISREVTSIIESGNKSKCRIEKLLDMLLDFGQMGIGESDFIRLNSYYMSFDRKCPSEYAKLYRRMNNILYPIL